MDHSKVVASGARIDFDVSLSGGVEKEVSFMQEAARFPANLRYRIFHDFQFFVGQFLVEYLPGLLRSSSVAFDP